DLAVAVNISRYNRDRTLPNGVVDGGSEGTIAIAHEYAHAVDWKVADDQIGLAVSVEVAHCDGVGTRPNAVADGSPEGAIAVPQQDEYQSQWGVIIRHDYIRFPVAVEVTCRETII